MVDQFFEVFGLELVQVDAVAGVFAGIAMSLNALVTSLLVPVAVTLLVR